MNENRVLAYLKGSKEELKKVSWPQKKTVINHTIAVIIISVLVALFLGALDFLFSWLVKLAIS